MVPASGLARRYVDAVITIAIDAGIRGALAALDERGDIVLVGDLPVSTHGSQKWIRGDRFLPMLFAARRRDRPARVFVEYTPAFPLNREGDTDEDGSARGNNLNAASKKGMVLGSMLSILEMAELRFDLVVPVKWKRPLNLLMPNATYRQRKNASLDLARKLFPTAPLTRQSDDGRAEALLIAHWAQQYTNAVDGELALVGGGKAA